MMSMSFVNLGTGDIEEEIGLTLMKIGQFVHCDRSRIFLFSNDGTVMCNTYEWCEEGIEPQINCFKGLPVEMFPWLIERLNRLENIYIPCVDALPPEAKAEKEILKSLSIQSLLIVPMAYRGTLLGFAGFDSVKVERTWSEESMELLTIMIGTIVNALRRKKVEQELIETTMLQALIQAIPDMLYFKDVQGRNLIVNKAFEEFTELSREEIIGKTDEELFCSDLAEYCRQSETEVLKTGKALRQEQYTVSEDGTKRVFEVIKVPLQDEYGDVVGLVGISRDITERKCAEEKLWQTTRSLRRFFGPCLTFTSGWMMAG